MNRVDLGVITTLLRSPRTIAESIQRGAMLRSIAAASIAAILLGMGVYGGVVGSIRGGLQITFAASKMPIVALVSLSLLAPMLTGAASAFGIELKFARAAALVLASTARASLVLLALAPVVALFATIVTDYHDQVMLATIGFGIAGLSGLSLLWHGIPAGAHRPVLAAFALTGFAIVSAQSAWVLRPWVTRPQSAVTFLRAPEGNVGAEVVRTSFSSGGDYAGARAVGGGAR